MLAPAASGADAACTLARRVTGGCVGWKLLLGFQLLLPAILSQLAQLTHDLLHLNVIAVAEKRVSTGGNVSTAYTQPGIKGLTPELRQFACH